MGLFGGCSNNGNDSSWIWILVIVALVICCSDNGCSLLGDRDNCCC